MTLIYQLIQETYVPATVLLMVALGGMFAERSGVTNIALEGIMILGGFVGIGTLALIEGLGIPPQLLLIIVMLVSALFGALYSMLHAYASIQLKANQIISATALNLFAPAFAIYVARLIQGGGSQISFVTRFRIPEVPFLSQIPIIGELFFTRVFFFHFILSSYYFLSQDTY